MKKILLSVVCLSVLTTNFAIAQDNITLKNGDEIDGKVLEITPTEIKYKKADNPNGPTITIDKSNVFMIKYENGTKDVFNNQNSANTSNVSQTTLPKEVKLKWTEEKRQGFGVFVDPMGAAFCGLRIGGEYRIKRMLIDGYLRFPGTGLIINAIYNSNNADELNGIAVGASFKSIFPDKIGGFFIGSTFDYSIHHAIYEKGERSERKSQDLGLAIMVNCGYRFQFKSGFFINTGAHFGPNFEFSEKERYTQKDNFYYSSTYNIENNSEVFIIGMLEVSLGFEF